MFDFAVFKRILAAAGLAGLFAGLLLTVVQQFQVAPILLKAETYEEAAARTAQPVEKPTQQHVHADGHVHEHEASAWQPANGWERTFFSALANVSLALGFGLLLGAAISLKGGNSGWRAGVLWGLAGYVVFFVAPSLGLPPEVPGTEAAELANRQGWWFMTVVATGAGVALLVFARAWWLKLLGVAILVIPHWIGAPQPAVHGSAAPADLIRAFLFATIIANAVFWLSLGGLVGFFHKKIT